MERRVEAVTARLVVVAWVVVAFEAVKFCKVLEPKARKLVALKACRVEEPLAKKLVA